MKPTENPKMTITYFVCMLCVLVCARKCLNHWKTLYRQKKNKTKKMQQIEFI